MDICRGSKKTDIHQAVSWRVCCWVVGKLCQEALWVDMVTSDYSSIQNTDIYYEKVEKEIHFLMGYDVEREHSARLLY